MQGPTDPPRSPVAPEGDALRAFALHVGYADARVVVRVRGELDACTAPTLGAHLTAVMDLGHVGVVLDLAALTFIDAAGLGVIATTAARLEEAGGTLTVRDASRTALRILGVTGLDAHVRIDESLASGVLRSELLRAASRPARHELVDAELLIVVAVASATLDGADGVSVTLRRDGRFATVASSNQTVLLMDAHQYETGEGPCLAAATEGREFHIDSLADEVRWPQFVPLALGDGIASILSTPLLDEDRPVGALNIYSANASAFGPHHQELATLYADQASRIVAARPDVDEEQLSARLTDALQSRLVLAQAQGVLMTRHRVTADEATATLHRAARAAGSSVLDHAAEVVASTHDHVGPLDRLRSG